MSGSQSGQLQQILSRTPGGEFSSGLTLETCVAVTDKERNKQVIDDLSDDEPDT